MNRISGAAVSEAEVNRLRDQIPNMGQSEVDFETSVDLYNDLMESTVHNLMYKYGFGSLEQAKESLYGPQSTQPTATSDEEVLYNQMMGI